LYRSFASVRERTDDWFSTKSEQRSLLAQLAGKTCRQLHQFLGIELGQLLLKWSDEPRFRPLNNL
jgi:hypothetical protein